MTNEEMEAMIRLLDQRVALGEMTERERDDIIDAAIDAHNKREVPS